MKLSLSFVLLALSATTFASPIDKRDPQVFTIPLTKQAATGSALDMVNHGLDRLEYFREPAIEKRQRNAPVSNAVDSYLAAIGIGSPATTYQLIVDTGSSNTWAGATKRYVTTSTTRSTGQSVSVRYGSGSFSGTEYQDSVTLASGFTITNQGVGAASRSSGFQGVDGILGVGPEDLTSGTVSGGGEVPTVLQTARSEGLIPANILGVYFAPTSTSATVSNGELTYGGTDASKTTSAITYQPVTSTAPASEYWGLTISSSLASGSQSGIVDTGTTLVYLPSTWYSAYLRDIPGATLDSNSGLVRIPKSSLNSIPDITFTTSSGNRYVYNKYAQLVEQGLYPAFGLSTSYYYSWVNNAGSSGTGLDFILGMKFLERFYSVYDTDNHRIGFATTANTSPTAPPP